MRAFSLEGGDPDLLVGMRGGIEEHSSTRLPRLSSLVTRLLRLASRTSFYPLFVLVLE